MPPRRLPNEQDNRVILRLSTAPIDSLEVDRLAPLLAKSGHQAGAGQVLDLRLALIKVYIHASKLRFAAKAITAQIKSVKTAIALLFEAAERLEEAKPVSQRGLRGIFGNTIDDAKGLDEWSEFSSKCSDAKLKSGPPCLVPRMT